MALNPTLMQELKKLLPYMSREEKTRVSAYLRERIATGAPVAVTTILSEMIKEKSPEEQARITAEFRGLMREERDASASINSVINMPPQESLEVMGAVNDLLEQKHMGGRSRRKRVKRKRTKRAIKR